MAADGAGGPRQALQAECRQGSRRGSLSGRRRSRHTPQCSSSSSASPPPPAGDDAEAEAEAEPEAAAGAAVEAAAAAGARLSPPAEPSLGPGLLEAAVAAAAAEAAAAEAAIHTPPGAPRRGGGARARRAGAHTLAANGWVGAAAAAAARPTLPSAAWDVARCARGAAEAWSAAACSRCAAAVRVSSSMADETPDARHATSRSPRAPSQKEPRLGGGTEITGAAAAAHAHWWVRDRGRYPGGELRTKT